MVGTGCSGTNSARYGTMREWVLSLTVVLVDGTIVKTRQRPRKSSAGYDLTRLFIGSEGTLGLVTEAVLKVKHRAPCENVAIAAFKNIRQAAEVVREIFGLGISLAAMEILDDVQMSFINKSQATSRTWKESPTLFFKFSGTENAIKDEIQQIQRIAKKNGSLSFEKASSKDEQVELWSARKESLWSAVAMKRNQDDHVWTTGVAVPISALPDIIQETKKDLVDSRLTGSIVGHVGDGNFHCFILFNDSERGLAENVVHNMNKRVIEMEGRVTREHGVGLVKRGYLEKELGPQAVNLMRQLKLAMDPLCLLNCDKVIRIVKPSQKED